MGNSVFVVTNGLLLLNAVLGFAIVLRHRRRARFKARLAAENATDARARRESVAHVE